MRHALPYLHAMDHQHCWLYRSGSSTLTGKCFDNEFPYLLESAVTRNSPMVILDDLDIHLEDALDPPALRSLDLCAQFGLRQLVSQTTHVFGVTLDVCLWTTSSPAVLVRSLIRQIHLSLLSCATHVMSFVWCVAG